MNDDAADDLLRSPEAGARVIRGSAIRAVGYVVGLVLGAVSSVFLLRYLGVVPFGDYVTVTALLGIVSGVSDAGLTAVGARELAIRSPGEERDRLLRNLVSLRLVVTPLGALVAVVFTVIAGYDSTLVWGTLVGGAGLVLINAQATMMMPFVVELKLARLAAVEVLKQVVSLAVIASLVAVGGSLLSLFAVPVAVGACALAVTPALIRRRTGMIPAFDPTLARMLVREALPMAVALALSVVYFRLLVILMSLMSSDREAGLFATSFRIIEVLLAAPVLLLSVALPVLAVASREDDARLRYGLQRMTEVALVASALLALVIAIVAKPAIELLGGAEYSDAAPILRIHALALIGLFMGQAWQLGLVAMGRQKSLVLASGTALVVVLVLGLVLIPLAEARGAAWAAVGAESALALVLLTLLAGTRRNLAPKLGFAWKVGVSAGVAATSLAIPSISAFATALIATGLYGAVALATGALPRETLKAFLPSAPRKHPSPEGSR